MTSRKRAKETKSNKRTVIIIIVIAAVLVLSVGGFILCKELSRPHRQFNQQFNRGFQLNQSQIDEVNSFFSSSPASANMTSYCSSHRAECFYYCRNNTSNDFCNSMMNYSRAGGGRTWSR